VIPRHKQGALTSGDEQSPILLGAKERMVEKDSLLNIFTVNDDYITENWK